MYIYYRHASPAAQAAKLHWISRAVAGFRKIHVYSSYWRTILKIVKSSTLTKTRRRTVAMSMVDIGFLVLAAQQTCTATRDQKLVFQMGIGRAHTTSYHSQGNAMIGRLKRKHLKKPCLHMRDGTIMTGPNIFKPL